MLSGIEQIFRDILIFVAVMSALFIALIVIVSKLPEDNPLKLVLSALSRRVGITLGAGVVAIPVEPIPGIAQKSSQPTGNVAFWRGFGIDFMNGSASIYAELVSARNC